MPDTVVLMVAHGSPVPEAIAAIQEFANRFAERCPHPSYLAYLEWHQPDLAAGLREAAAHAGAGGRIAILPLFLGAAGHRKNDLPVAVAWARREFPDVHIVSAAPFGPHANLVSLLGLRARQAVDTAGRAVAADRRIALVVGRGSSDPDSNAEIARIARLLFEKRAYASVEYAYQSVAHPTIAEGVDRAARLGAQQLVVVPYLLFTGWVEDQILKAAAERAQAHNLDLVMARPLGIDPLLLAVAEQRVDEALSGPVAMACDICKYRLPMAGYEDQVAQPQISHIFKEDRESHESTA